MTLLQNLPVRLVSRDDWTTAIVNQDNEILRTFAFNDPCAEAYFESFLTAAQILELKQDASLDANLDAEDRGNRLLSCGL